MTEPLLGPFVIFVRDGMFYPIQLCGRKPVLEEVADHAALNPDTLQVLSLVGDVLWSAETVH